MIMTTNKLCPILLLLIATAFFVSCNNDDDKPDTGNGVVNVNRNDISKEPALQRLEFPKVKGGNSRVLIHTNNDDFGINYSVEWDCDKKSQRWSCYQMYSSNRVQKTSRYYPDKNKGEMQYPYDPELPLGNYFTSDPFWNSGYDHGHICPSADRQYSKEANRQTFFLTNMQPQRNTFNAGVWAAMEQQVRNWNRGNFRDTLYVCKGGTIDRDDQIRGYVQNQMIIPKYFFTALLCKNASGYKALGFWIEHKDKDTDYPRDNQGNYQLSPYVVSIRELETLTGIDFFCNLDDETEDHVETLPTENIKSAWGLK